MNKRGPAVKSCGDQNKILHLKLNMFLIFTCVLLLKCERINLIDGRSNPYTFSLTDHFTCVLLLKCERINLFDGGSNPYIFSLEDGLENVD